MVIYWLINAQDAQDAQDAQYARSTLRSRLQLAVENAAKRMLDLEATKDSIAEMVRLTAMQSIDTINALPMEPGLGDAPATLKNTPPMMATPSAALICNAEFVMPAIIPE